MPTTLYMLSMRRNVKRISRPVRRWLMWIACPALLTACAPVVREQDPDVLLEQAWHAFRLADYRMALARFERVPDSPAAGEHHRIAALYGASVVRDMRQPIPSQDDARAAEGYRRIIAEAPEHALAPWSALALARMTHLVPVGEEPDYERVRAAYQEVIDRYPDHMAGHEALLYQQSTWIMTLEPEATRRALARLQDFVNSYPASPFLSAAYQLIGQGQETLGDADGQLEARIRELETMEIDPSSPASADLSWRYWQIATTAEFMAGRFDVARVYYQKLIDEYPLDFRKFPARQALARMDALEVQLRRELSP